MKKSYLLGISLLSALAMQAQEDYVTPYIWDEILAQQVSASGQYVSGQDLYISTYLLNMETKKSVRTADTYPGEGNCLANDGTIVGQNANGLGVIMKSGRANTPSALLPYPQSAIYAITPDARRVTGYYMPGGNPLYQPFIIDIDENGNPGPLIKLPMPPKDFFGSVAQGYWPSAISDDGRVVVGLVFDGSGFISWPIVYTQAEDGTWSYTQPTEALFNPDHKPLPEEPKDEDAPEYPKFRDYMTDEEYKAWQTAVENDPNQADEYWRFMGDESYKKWLQAIAEYDKAFEEWEENLDKYWDAINQLGIDAVYGGYIALSPDGKIFAIDKLGFESDINTNADYFYPYVINVKTGTLTELKSDVENLMPTQILEDGTIVCSSSENSFIPYVSYMFLPESYDCISFMDYLQENSPSYVPWLEDNLTMYHQIIGYEGDTPIYGDYTVTGFTAFSRNRGTIAGGLKIEGLYSYVYYEEESGVEEILPEVEDGIYTVYNLNGINILTTKDAERVNNLPKGIYIVNGKKVAI